MLRKSLLIIALFLTVAGASALTTVWFSARPVSAYSTNTSYYTLVERLDKLESDLRRVRLDGMANTRSINQIYRALEDLEDAKDFMWKMMVELHGKDLSDKILDTN